MWALHLKTGDWLLWQMDGKFLLTTPSLYTSIILGFKLYVGVVWLFLGTGNTVIRGDAYVKFITWKLSYKMTQWWPDWGVNTSGGASVAAHWVQHTLMNSSTVLACSNCICEASNDALNVRICRNLELAKFSRWNTTTSAPLIVYTS